MRRIAALPLLWIGAAAGKQIDRKQRAKERCLRNRLRIRRFLVLPCPEGRGWPFPGPPSVCPGLRVLACCATDLPVSTTTEALPNTPKVPFRTWAGGAKLAYLSGLDIRCFGNYASLGNCSHILTPKGTSGGVQCSCRGVWDAKM